jgi:hypothetical protein
MVKNKNILSKIGSFELFLLFSLSPKFLMGWYYGIESSKNKTDLKLNHVSDLITFQLSVYKNEIKWYVIFGSTPVLTLFQW